MLFQQQHLESLRSSEKPEEKDGEAKPEYKQTTTSEEFFDNKFDVKSMSSFNTTYSKKTPNGTLT